MQNPKSIQKLFGKKRLLAVAVFIFAVVAYVPYLTPGDPQPATLDPYPWLWTKEQSFMIHFGLPVAR